ncbi:MAG: nucleotidyl transferase AbiEii/AbiGii toxin family protein [Chloroflexi bacterium]|nr:nucleotidyl transferase AbiEii/AbiGii toxin family protein [Chloroflexota bacterium]
MTKRPTHGRGGRTSRGAARPPTQRELFRRAARDLGVSAADYERADILAQIAELLRRHTAIGRMLAFKGGAVMTLVDRSPRLSADLDAVVVTGGAVHDRQVRAALLAELGGRRLVTDVGIVNPGRQSLQYPFIKARSFSGLGDVNIRLEVSWREPPLLPTETIEVRIPRDVRLAAAAPRLIRLPVLARIERVAEKMRAFLERGLDRDAFDLHYQAGPLSSDDRTVLRGLIRRKLLKSELPEGCDLKAQFTTALAGAKRTWPRGLVIVAEPPAWADVERTVVATYEPLLQRRLRRSE